ncbi:MAG: hypothetical protein AB1Z98_03535 [Nannocystaceae bacterium]
MHIVVACTDRKRVPVADDRQLREVADADPKARASRWWKRLQESPTLDLVYARDLYAGEHWATALKLPAAVQTAAPNARWWVASAGYGLVGWDAPLKSYSATFAAGLDDSVILTQPGGLSRAPLLRSWWDQISSFAGPVDGAPRRIADLAAAEPRGAVVVVASPDYVRAMEGDLLAARDRLDNPLRLVVVSNRAKLQAGPLADHLVPVAQEAREVVGGTMQGLNARVALALLGKVENALFDARTFQDLYAAMTRDAKTPQRPKGEPMTDDQVIAFIKEQLVRDPKLAQTRLLRALRDAGRSCEQARFRGLYKRVAQA